MKLQAEEEERINRRKQELGRSPGTYAVNIPIIKEQ